MMSEKLLVLMTSGFYITNNGVIIFDDASNDAAKFLSSNEEFRL